MNKTAYFYLSKYLDGDPENITTIKQKLEPLM